MTPPPAGAPVITLLTDFGTADGFVAAMKGVILDRVPGATLVDVTHEIPPQDVRAAAYVLLSVYDAFPAGTVHLAVVDPGVGSPRRPIAVTTERHAFVGPDNGLFGWVLEREPAARVVHLTDDRFFRHPVSTTFHGRDVFAPVAAALASGVETERFGPPIHDPVRLDPLHPAPAPGAALRGSVLHVDRFGNCITNLRRDHLPDGLGNAAAVEVGGRAVRTLRRFYGEAEADEVFAIWGSAGFLEISANRASAARMLGVAAGAPLLVRRRDEHTVTEP